MERWSLAGRPNAGDKLRCASQPPRGFSRSSTMSLTNPPDAANRRCRAKRLDGHAPRVSGDFIDRFFSRFRAGPSGLGYRGGRSHNDARQRYESPKAPERTNSGALRCLVPLNVIQLHHERA
jgi:hypothetical protein